MSMLTNFLSMFWMITGNCVVKTSHSSNQSDLLNFLGYLNPSHQNKLN